MLCSPSKYFIRNRFAFVKILAGFGAGNEAPIIILIPGINFNGS
jgi:hypothetical protein